MNPNTGIPGETSTSEPDSQGWFEDTLASASELDLSFIDPRPPVRRYASVNGLQLSYLDWGNEHLPTLLFVHGFAQQAHSWDFAALAIRDVVHVVSIDLRGHGESDRAPNGTYSFDDMYADLDAFISSTNRLPIVVCGLSLGGTLAYMYASRNPAGVKALVIAESAPESQQKGRDAIRNFTSGPTEFESLDYLVDKVRELTPWRSADQVRRSLVHSVGQTDTGQWTWKYDPAIRSLINTHPDSQERWTALAKITAPTLLIRGEDSDITDVDTFERMKTVVPNSRVVSVAKAGHRVSGDNPGAFNSALRGFLLDEVGLTEKPEGR